METNLHFHYDIDAEDFTRAGEASSDFKNKLKIMQVSPAVVRKTAIAMYEGEINMVIHANGGTIDIDLNQEYMTIVLADKGPGIPDIELAMQEGYSTAPEEVISLGFGAGMGLPNMKRSSDRMNIETTLGVGTIVTLQINL